MKRHIASAGNPRGTGVETPTCAHALRAERAVSGIAQPLRRRYPRHLALGGHAHAEAQLIYAVAGRMLVHTAQGRWLVPPHLAVWVPAQQAHAIDMLSDVEMWTLYFPPALPGRTEALRQDAFVLGVTPLLRALVATLFDEADPPRGERAGLVGRLALHEIARARPAPTYLPMPAGAACGRIARLVLDDLRVQPSLESLAQSAATSARTVSRQFPRETGLTFKAWRQRARIVAAMERLAEGHSIKQIAADLGFAGSAAFAAAFRQVTGTTASAFARGADSVGEIPAPDGAAAAAAG